MNDFFGIMAIIAVLATIPVTIHPKLFVMNGEAPLPRGKILLIGIAASAIFFILFGITIPEKNQAEREKAPETTQSTGDNKPQQEVKPKDQAGTVIEKLKPEEYVKFPASNVACISKEALREILARFVRGEITKGNALFFSKENMDGQCIVLNQKMTYKILSVEYNNPDQPNDGIIEVVASGSKLSDGLWTTSFWAEPVK